MLVADNPTAEGGLEGAAQGAENSVRLFEDSVTASGGQNSLNFSPDKLSVPPSFSKATIGIDGSISFNPSQAGPASGFEMFKSAPVGDGGSLTSLMPDLGNQLAAVLKPLSAMPGALGLISALFEFLANFFSSVASAVFDPTLWAQQAQASIEAMAKLKFAS